MPHPFTNYRPNPLPVKNFKPAPWVDSRLDRLAGLGAGFEVTDAKTNGKPLLELGNRTTLHNLTIIYMNTPELGLSRIVAETNEAEYSQAPLRRAGHRCA